MFRGYQAGVLSEEGVVTYVTPELQYTGVVVYKEEYIPNKPQRQPTMQPFICLKPLRGVP